MRKRLGSEVSGAARDPTHMVPLAWCVAALSLSPSGMMHTWRQQRMASFAAAFDSSRYHVQICFVDDDGVRGRVCEAMLERVEEWADAGWWIYPCSASIGSVADGDKPPPSLLATLPVELATNRLRTPAARLDGCAGAF